MEATHDVFVSYASEDAKLAQDFYEMLESRGVRPFMAPKDIGLGKDWIQVLKDEMVKCEMVLFPMTPKSIGSAWVQHETGAAWVLGKRIIVAMIHVDNKDLGDILPRVQVAKTETQKEISDLVEEISSYVDFAAFWKSLIGAGYPTGDVPVVLSAKRPAEYIDGRPVEKPGHTVLVSYNEFTGILELQEELGSLRRRLNIIHAELRGRPDTRLSFEKDASLIVVGSKHANTLSEEVFELCSPPFLFESDENNHKYIHTPRGRFPTEQGEDGGSCAEPEDLLKEDHGIILRATNPFDDKKRTKVLVLAGNHGFGTQAAIKFVAGRKLVGLLRDATGDGDFAAVFRARVVENKPLDLKVVQVAKRRGNKWVLSEYL